MSTLVTGTFAFDVPPGVWSCGPTIRREEAWRVRWGGETNPGAVTAYVYGFGDTAQTGAGAAWNGPTPSYTTGSVSLPASTRALTSMPGNLTNGARFPPTPASSGFGSARSSRRARPGRRTD